MLDERRILAKIDELDAYLVELRAVAPDNLELQVSGYECLVLGRIWGMLIQKQIDTARRKSRERKGNNTVRREA